MRGRREEPRRQSSHFCLHQQSCSIKVEVLSLAQRSSLDLSPFKTINISLILPLPNDRVHFLLQSVSFKQPEYHSIFFFFIHLLLRHHLPHPPLPCERPRTSSGCSRHTSCIPFLARCAARPSLPTRFPPTQTNGKWRVNIVTVSCMSSWPGTVGGGRWHKISDTSPTFLAQHTIMMPDKKKMGRKSICFYI